MKPTSINPIFLVLEIISALISLLFVGSGFSGILEGGWGLGYGIVILIMSSVPIGFTILFHVLQARSAKENDSNQSVVLSEKSNHTNSTQVSSRPSKRSNIGLIVLATFAVLLIVGPVIYFLQPFGSSPASCDQLADSTSIPIDQNGNSFKFYSSVGDLSCLKTNNTKVYSIDTKAGTLTAVSDILPTGTNAKIVTHDGKFLIYSDSNNRIWKQELDTNNKNPQVLFNNPSGTNFNGNWQLSSDDTSIAFFLENNFTDNSSRIDSNIDKFWTINIAKTESKNLSNVLSSLISGISDTTPIHVSAMGWSNNSSIILSIQTTDTTIAGKYLYNLDKNTITKLNLPANSAYLSNDNETILYQTQPESGETYTIHQLAIATNTISDLITGNAGNSQSQLPSNFVLSPDKKNIAYKITSGVSNAVSTVYVFNTETKTSKEIISKESGRDTLWGWTNNNTLLFSRAIFPPGMNSASIHSIDISTKQVIDLVSLHEHIQFFPLE